MVVNHCTKHHLLLHNALSLVVECTIHYCLMHHGSLPITPCTIVQYTIYHYQVHHHTPFIIAQYSSIIVQCTIVIFAQSTINCCAKHHPAFCSALLMIAQCFVNCCTKNHLLLHKEPLVDVQCTIGQCTKHRIIHCCATNHPSSPNTLSIGCCRMHHLLS